MTRARGHVARGAGTRAACWLLGLCLGALLVIAVPARSLPPGYVGDEVCAGCHCGIPRGARAGGSITSSFRGVQGRGDNGGLPQIRTGLAARRKHAEAREEEVRLRERARREVLADAARLHEEESPSGAIEQSLAALKTHIHRDARAGQAKRVAEARSRVRASPPCAPSARFRDARSQRERLAFRYKAHHPRRIPMGPRPVLAITVAISLGFPFAGCVVLDAPHGSLAPATRHGLGVG